MSGRNSPCSPEIALFGTFCACRANFFALAPTPGRAWRNTSRTACRDMARLKPTTPLLAPNKAPLKPASPLRPKTAPNTAISHLQRRWRFQSHTDTSEQRRRRFQTTGPPHLQHPHAVPAGGPGCGTRGRWRGLAGQRADAPSRTSTHQAPLVWRVPEGPEGLAAVPMGGGGAWPDNEPTRRAKGSRRGRLAGGPPPTGTPSSPAPQNRTPGARNTSGATQRRQTATQAPPRSTTRQRAGCRGIDPRHPARQHPVCQPAAITRSPAPPTG